MKQGILQGTAVGGGLLNKGDKYNWVAEIEEVERVAHLSKIKVKHVSGADKKMLLEILPEWIPTKEIIFEPAPVEADKELLAILENYPFDGEWEDWKSLKAELLAWRDKQIVAELEKLKDEMKMHTVPESPRLITRSYLNNSIDFRINQLGAKDE